MIFSGDYDSSSIVSRLRIGSHRPVENLASFQIFSSSILLGNLTLIAAVDILK